MSRPPTEEADPTESELPTPEALDRQYHSVRQIRDRYPQTPMGINVLRSDARSAMAIAAVAVANCIRVNVHTGGMLTD